MRGIVLAGGLGTRMGDVTKSVNKHLLPVGGVPMIYWPIKTLRDNGIDDITIVSSPDGVGQLAKLLGGGYTYRVQDTPGGIVGALACAENKYDNRDVAVILGDNVFLADPMAHPNTLKIDHHFCENSGKCWIQACCFLKEVSDHRARAKQFGIAVMSDTTDPRFRFLCRIDEKPEVPATNLAAVGLYLFTGGVFEKLKTVKPSARGETEVTDLLNLYASHSKLTFRILGPYDFWGDAGTPDGLCECDRFAWSFSHPQPAKGEE